MSVITRIIFEWLMTMIMRKTDPKGLIAFVFDDLYFIYIGNGFENVFNKIYGTGT